MTARKLRNARQFAAETPAFSEDSLRWHIRHAEQNGLARALIRIGHRVYIDLLEFLELKLPPRDWVIDGFLQDRDLGMVHAYRGVGKSQYVLGLTYARGWRSGCARTRRRMASSSSGDFLSM